MPTTNLGLPLITGNLNADVVRDMNALAEAVDAKVPSKESLEGLAKDADLQEVDERLTTHLADNVQHVTTDDRTKWDGITVHIGERASLTKVGHTQLSSDINNVSEILSATPKAVKAAYDLANTAMRVITGTYTGNGTSGRIINLGLNPKFVLVIRNSGTSNGNFSLLTTTNSLNISIDNSGMTGNTNYSNQKLVANGFSTDVGVKGLNTADVTYHYVAFL